MDVSVDNETYSDILEHNSHHHEITSIPSIEYQQINEGQSNGDCMKEDSQKLICALWTTNATSTLLKLYDAKLAMLETPKKKKRIWIAIAESLKDFDIDVSPDQVRWKINALTKKYKHCIDVGKHEKFKYFKEMDKIYSKYNVDCHSYSITEYLSKKKSKSELGNDTSHPVLESRAMIEMRKTRLANRIKCDRFQSKIKLERQLLEYLHRQEEQRQFKDKIFERNLQLWERELETRREKLEFLESFENKKLQRLEKEQEEFLQIERKKIDLLKQMFHLN